MEQEHERLVADALVAYRQSWTALRQASEATWTQLELTVSQLKALLLIEARDFMTISEVADMMGIGRSSASILIDQLVQLSLVNRTEDQTDRRRTLVSLTEQAHDLAGRLYQCDQEYMHALFERIGDDDLRALSRGLRAIALATPATMAGHRGELAPVAAGRSARRS